MNQPTKKVAIVFPTHYASASADQEISLRHLRHYLGFYDIFCVAPEGLDMPYHNFKIVRFDKKYFESFDGYNRLFCSRQLYQKFEDYEYILIYHSDALAFRDELVTWCDKGYDYIGPPWPKDHGIGYSAETTVGNGGFCLRKIRSFLETIDRYEKSGPQAIGRMIWAFLTPWRHKTLKEWLRKVREIWRWSPLSKYVLIEDYFWSFEAKRYFPDFKVAPVSEALLFAFEVDPRWCYEQNGHHLPFGCHAWARYDRAFWEPYLLKDKNG